MFAPPDFEEYAQRCLKEVSRHFGISPLSIVGRVNLTEVVTARRILIQYLLPHTTSSLLSQYLGITAPSIRQMGKFQPGDPVVVLSVPPTPKRWELPRPLNGAHTLCPKCQSRSLSLSPHFRSKVWICQSCKYSWRYKANTSAPVSVPSNTNWFKESK